MGPAKERGPGPRAPVPRPRQLDRSQSLVGDTVWILMHILQNITYLDFRHMKDTSQTMHKVLAGDPRRPSPPVNCFAELPGPPPGFV